jgi:hypothetical protein
MKSIFLTALALAATAVVAEEANTEAVEKALPRGGGGGMRGGGFRGGSRGGGFRGGRGGRGFEGRGGRGWEGRGGWGGPGGVWLPAWGPAWPWRVDLAGPLTNVIPVPLPISQGESFVDYCRRVKRTRANDPKNLTDEWVLPL